MSKPNQDIRDLIENKRLKYYEVANAIGITPGMLCVWLRTEFTPERKDRVIKAINSIEV